MRLLPVPLLLLGLGSALSLCLTSCAGGGANVRSQLSEQQREIDDLRSLQARHTAVLSELKDDLRKISGAVEELEFQSVGKTRELERRLSRVSARVPPPKGVPEALLNKDQDAVAGIEGPEAAKFKDALEMLRQGEFIRARESFRDFITNNPDTAFTDNAFFWIGVCHEKLRQFDEAAVAYSEVYQRFPAEDRVPDALSRLADAFTKLGSSKEARLVLEKLIDEFPRSSYVSEAKTKLSKLKRSSRSRRR